MTIAFALYKYFPFGGLQRDFLRIALECQKQGHKIRVYTTSWQGDKPEGFDIKFLRASGTANHTKMLDFQNRIQADLKGEPATLLVGFNKMAGLDVYYASDTCFKEKVLNEKGLWYRLTSRCRAYLALEKSVFSPENNTLILTLTQHQNDIFQKLYQTQPERFHLLPLGIEKNTQVNKQQSIRKKILEGLKIDNDSEVLLLVGSSFKTKGLDRAINALANLPSEQLKKTVLLVCGNDKPVHYIQQARKLGCHNNIRFLGARKDIQQVMLASDLLVHPALTESAGMVLLEAVAAGLPVLATDHCGYAPYIKKAEAGLLAATPFDQKAFNHQLLQMTNQEARKEWRESALRFAATNDLYSQHAKAAALILNHARAGNTV